MEPAATNEVSEPKTYNESIAQHRAAKQALFLADKEQQRSDALKASVKQAFGSKAEAKLREKALMYAVQACPHIAMCVDITDLAVKFADYLRGGEA